MDQYVKVDPPNWDEREDIAWEHLLCCDIELIHEEHASICYSETNEQQQQQPAVNPYYFW